MARSPVYIEAKDSAGNVVAGATVRVKKRSDGTNATLYQAETGPTTISNPMTADSLGRALGWVDRGAYNVDVSGTGITLYTVPYDAAASADRAVDDVWLPANANITYDEIVAGPTGLLVGSFLAYRNAALSLVTGAAVVFDAEEYDASGWFNTTTGAFVPQVAGVYRLDWSINTGAVMTVDAAFGSYLQKNGANHRRGQLLFQRGAATGPNTLGTALVQANGTTDSFTVVVEHGNGGSLAMTAGIIYTFFQGEFVGRP